MKRTASKQKHVLLVDNDVLLRDLYAQTLSKEFRVTQSSYAQDAIDVLDGSDVDLLVLDVMIGAHNGIEILHEVRSHDDWLSVPICILSSQPVSDFPVSRDRWALYGVSEYCYKVETNPAAFYRAAKRVLTA